jgi:hypothetical protein
VTLKAYLRTNLASRTCHALNKKISLQNKNLKFPQNFTQQKYSVKFRKGFKFEIFPQISNLSILRNFSEYYCSVKFCGNFKFLFCNEIFLLRAWHVRDAKLVRKYALSVTHYRYQLLWKLRDCVTLSPFKGFLTDYYNFKNLIYEFLTKFSTKTN